MGNLCEKVIYKDNLINNVKFYKNVLGNKKLCAVVKANAYGHDLTTVVTILKGFVDYFAVANFLEAKTVRSLTSKPILILGEVDNKDISECIMRNIDISVSNKCTIEQIVKQAKKLNKIARIHFKVNTGMNRLGFNSIEEFKKVFYKYKYNKYVKYDGIYSHLYNQSDEKNNLKQRSKFLEFVNSASCENLIKHLSSSKPILQDKSYIFDMCRIGVGLYNYSFITKEKLLPVMEIKSKIINIIKVKKGETVGYECGFKANELTKIAVLSIGYADGYLRAFGNKAKVIINNKICNVVGNVCMDMCFCNVTDVKCKVGDYAIVLGKSKNFEINSNNLAEIANTIDYEILTNFKSDRMNICIK